MAQGRRFLSEATCRKALEVQIEGQDLILGMPVRFGLGFAVGGDFMPNPNTLYWGGSLAVIDMDARATYAYAMNRMADGRTGDMRALAPISAAWDALARTGNPVGITGAGTPTGDGRRSPAITRQWRKACAGDLVRERRRFKSGHPDQRKRSSGPVAETVTGPDCLSRAVLEMIQLFGRSKRPQQPVEQRPPATRRRELSRSRRATFHLSARPSLGASSR
jgi:hypothetical protein